MEIIDLSTVPGTTENFEGFIEQLCRRLGVEYGSYATMNPVTGVAQGYATYKPGLEALLHRRTSCSMVDPTIHRAALSMAPSSGRGSSAIPKFHTVFQIRA